MNELVDRLRGGVQQLGAVLPALLVATLILLGTGRGVAQLITNGQIVTIYYSPYYFLGNGFLLGLPFSLFIAAATALMLAMLGGGPPRAPVAAGSSSRT